MIRSLMIANRGEIACRIIRTARRLGIRTLTLYSDADRGALHSLLADRALHLPGCHAAETYLNLSKIIALAKEHHVDAIHPGYGFLSENADFARAVCEAGLIFVGPPASAIEDMGSKARAKVLMHSAGVPLLPGYHGDGQDEAELYGQAEQLGYPLLIKAVAGGGGRGLRIVNTGAEFGDALGAVKREASSAFADDRVLLERYLPHARHIEVQVFADNHGHYVHLYERDCSIQRRHQKLIEEAPAPGLDEGTRSAMGLAAIEAAKAINYSGAGTVEFLYQDGSFYFMEMNTRLQVEHPVTEAITGLDLVEWQLRIACGESLPLQQADIQHQGWAVEARVNAESGPPDFLPSSGRIESLHWPTALPGVRVDSGFRSGDRVSVYYDSLLGKVIAWADTREQAACLLSMALQRTQIGGITHNAGFLRAVVETPAFVAGDTDTGFLDDNKPAIELLMKQQQWLKSTPYEAVENPGQWGPLSSWRQIYHSYAKQYHLSPLFNAGEVSPACSYDYTAGPAPMDDELQIKAPLPGRVVKVLVNRGEQVSSGQALLIMEAMKMEHTLRAGQNSTVADLYCQSDDMVQPDQLLVELSL